MGRIWMPGEIGGVDLDVITAGADDVLLGKVIVGPDGEPLTGVLTLTGSAADSQVLAGKTYYNTDAKVKRTGAMPNQGAVSPAGLNCGESYSIPAGYHNGQGKVAANSLASQTGVQSGKTAAAAAQILTGYEAWVNGGRVTGGMANQGAQNASVNCGGTYTIPAGYHNGSGKVTGNSLASQTGVQSGKAAAGAGQILSGYEAWVNGGRVTGNMANQGKKEASLDCGGSYTISAGYHNGQGKVVANSLASQTDATAAAGDILESKTAWVKGSKVTGSIKKHSGAWPKARTVGWDTNNKYANLYMELGAYLTPTETGGTEFVAQAPYSDKTATPGASDQTVSPDAGKVLHNVTVKAVSGLSAGNIKNGATVGGVTGTYKGLGNAAADQVLSGKTFSTASLSNAEGTMKNLRSSSNLKHTSDNDTKVLLGDAAYVSKNSDNVTRVEIRYNGDVGYLEKNTLIAVPQGTMATAAGLTASKLAKGQTVLGVEGSYTNDATAAAGDILKDKIAYVKGDKVTGAMESMAGQTITPGTSQQTVSCSGKKMTGNVIVNAIPGYSSLYKMESLTSNPTILVKKAISSSTTILDTVNINLSTTKNVIHLCLQTFISADGGASGLSRTNSIWIAFNTSAASTYSISDTAWYTAGNVDASIRMAIEAKRTGYGQGTIKFTLDKYYNSRSTNLTYVCQLVRYVISAY